MAKHRSRKGGVLCVGRIYCDIIFTGIDHLPALGEEKFASEVSLHAGGGAYITAAYFALLGRPVSLQATLPSGPFAGFIRDELKQSGIDIDHCVESQTTDGPQLTVALSMHNDRAFITKRSGSALPSPTINWQEYPSISHLHIGELATLCECPTLVADAHEAGVTVSLDCSWDDGVFSREDLDLLLSDVDIFLPNEAEYDKLVTLGFHAQNTWLCVIKMGELGARAIQGSETTSSMAKAVEVVDTTGAGDAFNCGFIHAWLNGTSLEGCLALGNDCGAQAVTTIGGINPAARGIDAQKSC